MGNAFHVHHRTGVVMVPLVKVDRLERVPLDFPSTAIDEDALEDFVRLILGHESSFLTNARFAGLQVAPRARVLRPEPSPVSSE